MGNAELFFPVPFVEDLKSVRIGAFLDAGSVADNFNFGPYLRYSAGLSGEWLSPFGALAVSVAYPLNKGSVSCDGAANIDPAAVATATAAAYSPDQCHNADGTTHEIKDTARMFQFSFGQNF